MFTHMRPVKKEIHKAHGTNYELHVYRVDETGEYRIYVSKGSFGLGPVYTASQDVVDDAKTVSDVDIIGGLISTAKHDIDRNEFNDF